MRLPQSYMQTYSDKELVGLVVKYWDYPDALEVVRRELRRRQAKKSK